MIENRVGELIALKERIDGRRWSYRDLAAILGVTPHTIGRWVRNEVGSYDRETLASFCDFFECDIADLLIYERPSTGEGDPQSAISASDSDT